MSTSTPCCPASVATPEFTAKDPSEIVTLAFDFANLTAAPTTPVCSIAHHAGASDASPTAVLSGSPTITGTKLLQQVRAGVAGADYILRAQADTASGDRYVIAAILPVRHAG